jgi:carbamoyltransferase
MNITSVTLLGHDSSLCIIKDGTIDLYLMEERFSRVKHDAKVRKIIQKILNLNIQKIYFNSICLNKSITVHHHLNEDHIFLLKKYLCKLSLEHHLYHAFCGFYNSNFDESIIIAVDGIGKEIIINNLPINEMETVYLMNKTTKSIKLLHKGFTNDHKIDKIISKNKFITTETSVGGKFSNKAEEFGFSFLDSGKVMGLAQYKNNKEKLQYPYNTKEWKKRVDDAYEVQQETQNHVLSLIQKYIEETGVKNVVISGGYGLNCVANYHYLKNLKDINLYIDPICFDAGISIGSAYYHYIQETQNNPPIQPLKNAYIGYKEETYDLYGLESQKVSYGDIVNLLLQKNVIALFQGRSEAGQRALGNRSLLFDPRVPNGKDLVNQIKKRENFRPFAGTILLEEAHKWFNMLSLKESPYMQYAMDAYENAIKQVPAIIHADNTCRIQTVTQEQNEHFYNLISCFFEKTGVPMLMNTSFNLGGEPLVETFEHAIHTLKNSMIEYLYLPEIETLVTIKNKKLMYQ